jgi:hypothetical protein
MNDPYNSIIREICEEECVSGNTMDFDCYLSSIEDIIEECEYENTNPKPLIIKYLSADFDNFAINDLLECLDL